MVRALSSTKRVVVIDAPTGVGKSVINIAFATAQAARFAYLTADRGLQDQIMQTFPDVGLVDVRGMSNYPCYELPPRPSNTCEKGPCLDGFACPAMFGGCAYFDRVRAAVKADRINTNYAMWMTAEGIGQRDILLLDEAHAAAEQVGNHLRLRFTGEDELALPRPERAVGWDIYTWAVWAEKEMGAARRELADAMPGTGEHRKLKKLIDQLEMLAQASGEWVWEFDEEGVTLEPVWPAPYVERLLFRGVPRLILSSATIRPTHMAYLGLAEADYEFISALSPFPPARRPITWIRTVQVSQDSSEYELQLWLNRIDEIIDARPGRKGIVHTHNYKLAKYIKAASRHRDQLLLPTKQTTRSVVERFKAMPPPAVIVSPAVYTGYDFPYEAARWQIIAKLPFAPVKSSPILLRRALEDKQYPDHLAADALVQTAGRVVRAEDDLGETFIIDDNWRWFQRKRELFPGWFKEALREERNVPDAPGLH